MNEYVLPSDQEEVSNQNQSPATSKPSDYILPSDAETNQLSENQIDKNVKNLPSYVAYPIAAARGVTRDIPFAQDIGAGINAARTYIGGHPAGVPTEGTFGERFSAAKRAQEAVDEALAKEYPVTTYGSQIAGAFGLPMAGPATGIASRLEPLVGSGAARALGLGSVGAGYGGLYGLGSGDTADQRLRNAGLGAATGFVGGAAIPAAVGGIGSAASSGLESLGLGNPANIAAKRVGSVIGKDFETGRFGMSAQDVAEARAAGQPTLPIDVGGEASRGLARTVANSSPEARNLLSTAAHERFSTQNDRFSEFMKNLFGNDLNNQSTRDALSAQARNVNTPAYKAAYAKGASGVWNSDLENLLNVPEIREAIPDALRKSTTQAVLGKMQPIRNPFVQDANGNLTLAQGENGQTIKPTLEFWDQIKRSIDDTINVARRSGNAEAARDATQVKQALVGHLDAAIPEYAQARTGAYKFFGAENALEAGEKFLGMADTAKIAQAKSALGKMSPQEQEFFAQGLASQIQQKAKNAGMRRDIVKLFNSPETADKMRLGLGQDRANQVEAYLRRENIMDAFRNSLGNSTSAQQHIAAIKYIAAHGGGMWGGAAAGAAAAYRENGLDAESIAKGATYGALAGAFAGHMVGTSSKVSENIARMFVSEDPAMMQKAISMASKNPKMLQAIRRADTGLAALSGKTGSAISKSDAISNQQEQQPIQRASGGRVSKRDYPAKRASRIEKLAMRTHEQLAYDLKPMMQIPDHVITNALRIAKN